MNEHPELGVPENTAVAITETVITDNAAPDNNLIEVNVTITSEPYIRLFVRLAAIRNPQAKKIP